MSKRRFFSSSTRFEKPKDNLGVSKNLFPVVKHDDIVPVGATGDEETFWERAITNAAQGIVEGGLTECLKTVISVRGKWVIAGKKEELLSPPGEKNSD